MTELLDSISAAITQNAWLAPLLAFLAGILTSVTPCALSGIPLVIGYVGAGATTEGKHNTKRAFWLSITFVAGSAITFTIFGAIASLAGGLVGVTAKWWYLVLGIIMVLMSLQLWGIFEIIPTSRLMSKNKKRGFLGAFIAGILGGIFSSPCSTPVLIVLLAIVSQGGNILWGILLLLIYSIGHGVLAVVAGTSVGFMQRLSSSEKYSKAGNILKIVMGIAVLVIGFYMFYLGF